MIGLGRPPAEAEINDRLVRRLLAEQFPQWAGLRLRAVAGAGWDHEIYRLGTDLAVRLPRREIGARQVGKEHRWLPALAGRLPLTIPAVVGQWALLHGLRCAAYAAGSPLLSGIGRYTVGQVVGAAKR